MPNENEKQNINLTELNMKIQNIEDKLQLMPTKDEVKLAIKEGVEEAIKTCEKKFATKDRLGMLEKVVYGFVGMILTAFAGALIYLVIN